MSVQLWPAKLEDTEGVTEFQTSNGIQRGVTDYKAAVSYWIEISFQLPKSIFSRSCDGAHTSVACFVHDLSMDMKKKNFEQCGCGFFSLITNTIFFPTFGKALVRHAPISEMRGYLNPLELFGSANFP